MRKEQREIVSNALEKLSPELITSIIQNNDFITYIRDGVNNCVIVDFTQKMDLDYYDFLEKSRRLYEEFAFVPKWYEY